MLLMFCWRHTAADKGDGEGRVTINQVRKDTMKYIILLIIVIAVLYVHYRGRVRYRFWRQLSDHSTFTGLC